MLFPTMYLLHIHLGFRVALGFILFGRLTHRRMPYAVPVRQVGGLPPASFRFHLAVDTLALGYALGATSCARDFHPLDHAHAGHTESVRAAASGEAHIRTQLPEAPATVTGDPLELELLIVNLIKNAWQAQSGGSLAASKKGVHPVIAVGIAVAPGMEKGTEKVLGRRNGSVILTVSNPGPVLDDEAFARLNQIADSVKPEGLGMGLSIVRGICDSHAATLNFRRNPAGGVTARVVFAPADPDNSNKESSAS